MDVEPVLVSPNEHPYGQYSPASIAYFSASDSKNRLWRELLFQEELKILKRGGRLLDVGAGCGGTALVWRDLGFNVVACDIQPFFVEHMKGLGLDARVVDATDIQAGLGEDKFDVVYAGGLTPQVRRVPDNVYKVYKSIHIVLNPGGYFVFDFSISRSEKYKQLYYNPSEVIQIIDTHQLFRVMKVTGIKSIPAGFYTQWNRMVLYYLERVALRHLYCEANRYVLQKL